MRQMTGSGMSEVTKKMQLRDLRQSSGQNFRAWVTAFIQAYHSLHGMNPSSEYARKLIERGALPQYQLRLRELASTSNLEQVILSMESWESLISVIPSSSPSLSSSTLPQVSPSPPVLVSQPSSSVSSVSSNSSASSTSQSPPVLQA